MSDHFTLTPLNLILIISAVWRLGSLLANEDGPFLVFRHLRQHARQWSAEIRFFQAMHFSTGLECEWCNSLWISFPFVLLWVLLGDVVLLFALPLSLSAGVIVLKYLVECLNCLKDYLELLGKETKG